MGNINKLPEKWCIAIKTNESILVEWLNKNSTNNCKNYFIGNMSKYLYYPDYMGSHHWNTKKSESYEEITFQ